MFFPLALGEEDEIGAAQGVGWFAEDSSGQNMFVAERILSIDEEEVKAIAEAEVLEAVIEKEGVSSVVSDGVAGTFDSVGIDEHGDAGEIAGEHEGLVSCLGRIEEDRIAVRNNAGGRGDPAWKKLIGQAGEERFGSAFVAATEDSDAAACLVKRAGEFFNDGSFAGATYGEVADADDHDPDGVSAKDGILIEAGAQTHDACVNRSEEEQERFKEGCAASSRTIEDDIGGKLFERFESLDCHEGKVEILWPKVEIIRYRAGCQPQ